MVASRGALLLLAAVLIPACGPAGVASSLLTIETRREVQVAATAIGMFQNVNQAAGQVLVESGISDSTSTATYPTEFHQTVNLGEHTADGHPRYPGFSGLVSVDASGPVSGSGDHGSAAYAVEVTAATGLTYVDTVSGVLAGVPQGAKWTFALQVGWTFEASLDGAVIADSTETWSERSFTSYRQGKKITGTADGSRHRSADYIRSSGTLTATAESTFDWTVTWEDADGAHEVLFQATASDAILITVGGTMFGPLTESQVRTVFRVQWI